uniref:Ovule protein n=1 Tax=Schistosoma mansoni TaxID=6183 RepID=A0A5K4F5S3_SCHMA
MLTEFSVIISFSVHVLLLIDDNFIVENKLFEDYSCEYSLNLAFQLLHTWFMYIYITVFELLLTAIFQAK